MVIVMRRKEARAEEKKLAGVMKALNTAPADWHDDDPLLPIFAVEWIRPTPTTLPQREAAKRYVAEWAAAVVKDKKYPTFAPQKLHQVWGAVFDGSSKRFDAQGKPRSTGRAFIPLKAKAVGGRGFHRSARRFRGWIQACLEGPTAARRIAVEIKKRPLTTTDWTAFSFFSRILALGIYRCQHAKCGKLNLNTSGHADRKYCSGTKCAYNADHARMMARAFARKQAGKIRHVKAAIAECPSCDEQKRWIAAKAGVTLRWITEAERRGDIRLPG